MLVLQLYIILQRVSFFCAIFWICSFIVEKFEFRCLFDKRVVIILELKSSHLLKRKEEIIDKIQKHLQEHYHLNDDAHYAKIVLDVLTDCLKHVLIEHENMDDAKREFIKLFQLFCTGVMGQMI